MLYISNKLKKIASFSILYLTIINLACEKKSKEYIYLTTPESKPTVVPETVPEVLTLTDIQEGLKINIETTEFPTINLSLNLSSEIESKVDSIALFKNMESQNICDEKSLISTIKGSDLKESHISFEELQSDKELLLEACIYSTDDPTTPIIISVKYKTPHRFLGKEQRVYNDVEIFDGLAFFNRGDSIEIYNLAKLPDIVPVTRIDLLNENIEKIKYANNRLFILSSNSPKSGSNLRSYTIDVEKQFSTLNDTYSSELLWSELHIYRQTAVLWNSYKFAEIEFNGESGKFNNDVQEIWSDRILELLNVNDSLVALFQDSIKTFAMDSKLSGQAQSTIPLEYDYLNKIKFERNELYLQNKNSILVYSVSIAHKLVQKRKFESNSKNLSSITFLDSNTAVVHLIDGYHYLDTDTFEISDKFSIPFYVEYSQRYENYFVYLNTVSAKVWQWDNATEFKQIHEFVAKPYIKKVLSNDQYVLMQSSKGIEFYTQNSLKAKNQIRSLPITFWNIDVDNFWIEDQIAFIQKGSVFSTFNISDPYHPSRTNQISLPVYSDVFAVKNHRIYFKTSKDGIATVFQIDTENDEEAKQLFSHKYNYQQKYSLHKNMIYCMEIDRILFFDLLNLPTNENIPAIDFEETLTSWSFDQNKFTVIDKWLFLAESDKIKMFDISHPEFPIFKAEIAGLLANVLNSRNSLIIDQKDEITIFEIDQEGNLSYKDKIRVTDKYSRSLHITQGIAIDYTSFGSWIYNFSGLQ